MDNELTRLPSVNVSNWAGMIYWIGVENSIDKMARILRGPYVQHAYCHGWKSWHRDTPEDNWEER